MANRPQPRVSQVLFLIAAACWLAIRPRRPRRTLLWSAGLFAADLLAIPLVLRSKPVIDAAELETLDTSILLPLDRISLQVPVAHWERSRRWSDTLLRATVAIPFLLMCFRLVRRTIPTWLADYVWGHALTYTIYTFSPLGPAFVDKYRPIVYRSEAPPGLRLSGNNRNSQYSGHTGNAAFGAVFTSILVRRLFPDSPISAQVAFPATALGVGLLRIRAQKHFPTDVFFALAVGTVIAAVAASQVAVARPDYCTSFQRL